MEELHYNQVIRLLRSPTEGYANYLALMQPDGTFSIINAMTPLDGTDSSVIAVNPFFLDNDEMPKMADGSTEMCNLLIMGTPQLNLLVMDMIGLHGSLT